MIRRPLLAAVLVSVIAFSAAGAEPSQTWKLDLAGGQVEFLAVGRPSAVKIRGKTSSDKKDALTGVLKVQGLSVTGEAKYDLDALETGIGLRDRHMKEKYLEVPKYPTAVFKLTKFTLPQAFVDGDFDAEEEPFTGSLTFHGVTQEVSSGANLKRQGNRLFIDFIFPVKVTQYKIPVPSFMGITVGDDVKVTVKVSPLLQKGG